MYGPGRVGVGGGGGGVKPPIHFHRYYMLKGGAGWGPDSM